jgi:hypothetical protein
VTGALHHAVRIVRQRRGSGEFDSSEGFRDFIEYNVEAEALGFHGTFVVEHHFTGFGQVSATLNLLTWLGARTHRLRLGTAVIVLPWHNPFCWRSRQRRWTCCRAGGSISASARATDTTNLPVSTSRWRKPMRGSMNRWQSC